MLVARLFIGGDSHLEVISMEGTSESFETKSTIYKKRSVKHLASGKMYYMMVDSSLSDDQINDIDVEISN